MLSRRTANLLGTVNGKPHATQDDHVDTLPTPPNSNSTTRSSISRKAEAEEDINREPESSDDERTAPAQVDGPTAFKRPSQDSEKDTRPQLSKFQKPTFSSPASAGSKRSNDSDPPGSDPDDAIFGSQVAKKQRTSFANIHAPTTNKRREVKYGKASKPRSPKKDDKRKLKEANKEKEEEKVPLAKFQAARGSDMFAFGSDAQPTSELNGRSSRSPSLSSLSDAPPIEEVQTSAETAASHRDPEAPCTICGRAVDLLLKQGFEDEFAPGKRLSYKWQQRFCRFHKQHEARGIWREKGYPNIIWDNLEKRMMKYDSHLESVLNGKKPSHFRDELAERLKGRTKTTLQAVTSEDAKAGIHVGYYGPRGEKAM